jgi:biopolymer transport protein ExbB
MKARAWLWMGLLLATMPVLAATSLDEVAQQAAAVRAEEGKLNAQREAAFQKAFNQQQQLLNGVASQRAALDATTSSLSARFDANEKRVVELEKLLTEHQGNLGELFGVTRQVAGDAVSELRQSMIAGQFVGAAEDEDRETFLRRLASAKALPSIAELERLWLELQREMTASGQVARFNALVRAADGEPPQAREVVRIGPFTASAGDAYLAWLPSEKVFVPYQRQPAGKLRDVAAELARAQGDERYVEGLVDPARGALLGMVVERPNWLERIKVGGMIGYVTIALGLIGVAAWLGQLIYLVSVRTAVAWQLRNLSKPSPRNPLGRLLAALEKDKSEAVPTDMAELHVSAAVLREVPKLERFQGFLRLAVAAGPLLGLIGTVIGMIITFQTITASGASDPKLVAHGIGQAMIATVLGLGIAIPLLFANSLLAALSRAIIQILDEHGEGLLANSLTQGRQGTTL